MSWATLASTPMLRGGPYCSDAVGWLHLGANIGAATNPAFTVQASDDGNEARLVEALSAAGLAATRRTRAAPCRPARPRRCTGAAGATPR